MLNAALLLIIIVSVSIKDVSPSYYGSHFANIVCIRQPYQLVSRLPGALQFSSHGPTYFSESLGLISFRRVYFRWFSASSSWSVRRFAIFPSPDVIRKGIPGVASYRVGVVSPIRISDCDAMLSSSPQLPVSFTVNAITSLRFLSASPPNRQSLPCWLDY